MTPPSQPAAATLVEAGSGSERARTSPEQLRAIAAVRSRLFGEAPEVRIGRYVLERQLGVGGMGEVYLAEDPELGRKVAVKQVRAELGSPAQRARLVREAQTLARLSHPNVVQVHEVGDDEGETYLAMEYVEGLSLARWLAAEARSWTAILAVFVDAGRGLAAAHSAELVHRDFKPANVLIGRDGRPRVADFGLALGPGELDTASLNVAGTIRYMALEQLRGQAIDGRADQFSFCVALYEALWDQRPFGPSTDVRARVRELEADRPAAPPWSSRVPRRVWAALRRGLRCDPEQRWPSMRALLDVLDRIPRQRRRRRVAGLTIPLVASLGLGLAAHLSELASPCREVDGELAELWNPTRRAELGAAFEASAVAHADASSVRVRDRLDAWTKRWLAARVEQCQAAASSRDDPALARARRACLERQRQGFATLVEGLAAANPAAIERAVEASSRLPSPERCEAAALVDGPAPAPAELQRSVEQLRLALTEAEVWRQLGQADPDHTRELLARARALGYGPVEAEALAERGRSELAAGSAARGLDELDAAAKLALATGHRRLLAELWTSLALHRLTDYPDPDAGPELLELAEAAWFELSPTPDVRARLALGQGWVASDPARAAEAFERALELDAAGPIAPRALSALAELAEGDEALRLRQRALVTAEEVFGPEHPVTARHVYNLGVVHHSRGELDAAEPLFVRAVELWTAAHEAREHPDLARAHLLLADMCLRAGDLDGAREHALALAAIQAQTLPPDHADLGDAPMLLGRVAALRGDRRAALEYIREALARYEASDGPGDDRVLALRLDLAGRQLSLNDRAAAAATYAEVLTFDPAPPRAALAHLGLAEIALRDGDLAGSREQLGAIEALGLDALGGQRVSYELLRALVALRGGCRGCAAAFRERIAAAILADDWTLELLEPWFEELELSPRERAQLGLLVHPRR
ncbi:Serine/threonine-protein kinase PrkC [Enhygromyxa salina]|uniref:Serine/threonine-protein kinase PrkC n=1 Tax=Enhygromyxa salina TaxID=215803 RepID=A0A2S9XEM2_9BACT|nr:serine/threonine-protein kinase [Enhygromyxa salina]PRP91314.1 Serine/threonine-protein kinase PrkC [Enhygromyxa salina]